MSAPTTNIAVILGHPDMQSYCAAIAHAYAESARATGAAVRETRPGGVRYLRC